MVATAVRVFLADDHPIFRRGLRGLLDAQPDIEVVGEADDGRAAVEGVSATRPDIAVLDFSMPGMDGAQAAAELRRSHPGVKVLMLSARDDQGSVDRMLSVGVSGYVVKSVAANDIVRAIRSVAAGEMFVDPALSRPANAEQMARPTPARGELSERETEVLTRIARGHAMKAIAAVLQVGLRTVETYKARGMDKLGIRTRAELVRYAIEHGWLAPQ